jgi:hypothetical protein
VNWYSDVFDIAFSSLDRDTAKTLWKEQLTKPMSSSEPAPGEREDEDR